MSACLQMLLPAEIPVLQITVVSILFLSQQGAARLMDYHEYTVFQKKTPTHIIGYKLKNSCVILIIFGIKIPHII